ncbi:MAG: polyprenyl synthetase family protein [Paludibacter sp.]|nr:polyprenyl synthetase family protein [Paludibacter sp.]
MKSFNQITEIISTEIEKLDWNKEPRGLYEPIGYVLSMGGKRIRPALTLMACNLFSDNIIQAIKPALGIEVFHNFTLLHDDIIDRADMRRGKPTVHKKWNENTAILSGDVMQIAAYQLIAETPVAYLKPVLDLFSKTAAQICEGQQYDVEFERIDSVEAEDYLKMIRLKTAVLLGCALKTGAITGGAEEQDAQYLYDFGINLGMAFQLKDDMLDVYGNETTFGKKIGGDILCNKKTFLLISALKVAKDEIKDELNACLHVSYQQPDQKINAVTAIYNLLEVKKICEDKMFYFYNKAIAILDKVSVPDNNKQVLIKLAEKLMWRED